MIQRTPARSRHHVWLWGAVPLVALNLRASIAAVAPVLEQIRADLGLSPAVAGLLTTLPLLCFAFAAPAIALLTRRIGLEKSVLVSLMVIAGATAVRVIDGAALLMVGTMVLALGIAIGNITVPVIVKRDLGRAAGPAVGLYAAALAGGAAISAALTAPAANLWGWRTALAIWTLLALIAVLVWLLTTAPSGDRSATRRADLQAGHALPVWRSLPAWAITIFLASQATCFYSMTAWLPTMLGDIVSLDVTEAGLAMATFQLLGIAGTMTVPLAAARWSRRAPLGWMIIAGWSVMIIGLLVEPGWWLAWTIVGGLAQGGGLSLSLTLIVMRSRDTGTAHGLSSLSQVTSYSLGALGPVALGSLYQQSGGWTVPLLVLLGVVACQAIVVTTATRREPIGRPPMPAAPL